LFTISLKEENAFSFPEGINIDNAVFVEED